MFKRIIEDWQDRRTDKNRRVKRAKIRRVFEREGGLGAGKLSRAVPICDHPGRCALGALLAAVGVPDADLMGKMFVSWDNQGLLEDEYGLTQKEQDFIMDKNDSAKVSTVCPAPIENARICEVNRYVAALA